MTERSVPQYSFPLPLCLPLSLFFVNVQQWRIPPAIPAPLAQPKTHHDLLSSKTRTERKADATEKQEVALKPTAAADRVTQASASADQPLTKMKRAKSKPGSMGQHQAAAAGPDEGQPPKKAKALTS